VTDQDTLAQYVETWWKSLGDLIALLEELPDDAWNRPTDLPGWTVHDVVAHVAHLEHVSVGGAHDEVAGIEVGTPAHVKSFMSVFTEQGVVARRAVAPAELVAAIRRDTAVRREQLASGVPDAAEPADGVFGAIGWTWGTLLRNRPLDVWMHEQDVRRATGRPGNLDSVGAQHTIDYLAEALPFVLGKRVGAPAGTTAVLEVDGSRPVAAEIGEDGRGRALAEEPDSPTVRLAMDRETFVIAAGGRRAIGVDDVEATGDAELAAQVLARIGTTP
jgi:uncharacterized protein (TIGR03083 family)